MTGCWRKLHNEELHNLYSSPSIIRMIKCKKDKINKAYSTHRDKSKACTILVGKLEGSLILRNSSSESIILNWVLR
jgi:hypothetical protein